MKTCQSLSLILSLICVSFANKGQIQFTLDQHKFDLPLDRVMVRVENNILISLRAELNDEKEIQLVNMEFAINNFADKMALSEFTQLEVRTNKVDSRNVKLLSISGDRANSTTIPNTLKGNSEITIQKVTFQNGHLELEGTFTFSYKAENEDKEVIIKDGRFRIII